MCILPHGVCASVHIIQRPLSLLLPSPVGWIDTHLSPFSSPPPILNSHEYEICAFIDSCWSCPSRLTFTHFSVAEGGPVDERWGRAMRDWSVDSSDTWNNDTKQGRMKEKKSERKPLPVSQQYYWVSQWSDWMCYLPLERKQKRRLSRSEGLQCEDCGVVER